MKKVNEILPEVLSITRDPSVSTQFRSSAGQLVAKGYSKVINTEGVNYVVFNQTQVWTRNLVSLRTKDGTLGHVHIYRSKDGLVDFEQSTSFAVSLRGPRWMSPASQLYVNGIPVVQSAS